MKNMKILNEHFANGMFILIIQILALMPSKITFNLGVVTAS